MERTGGQQEFRLPWNLSHGMGDSALTEREEESGEVAAVQEVAVSLVCSLGACVWQWGLHCSECSLEPPEQSEGRVAGDPWSPWGEASRHRQDTASLALAPVLATAHKGDIQ